MKRPRPIHMDKIVLFSAHGQTFTIAPPTKVHAIASPSLTPDECALLCGQVYRWNLHHDPPVVELSPEMVAGIAEVKRVFRDGGDRATIADFEEGML